MKIKNICCIGAGYVGGPTMAVLALNNPHIKVTVVDINKDFSKKVNATSYPLHFIIDGTGKIIARIEGDLDEARKVIIENLK